FDPIQILNAPHRVYFLSHDPSSVRKNTSLRLLSYVYLAYYLNGLKPYIHSRSIIYFMMYSSSIITNSQSNEFSVHKIMYTFCYVNIQTKNTQTVRIKGNFLGGIDH